MFARAALALIVAIAWTMPAGAALPLGKVPKKVVLAGDDGGKVAGGNWSSGELRGKPAIIFYVDPDESDLNEHVSDALKHAGLNEDLFHSVAIINMDATWLPNGIIQGKLEDKQKEFPRTIYVRDNEKVMVSKWGLGDDTYAISVLDSGGSCRFSHDGKLSAAQTKKVVSLLRELTAAP
jgi:predicted transcriptional regulator